MLSIDFLIIFLIFLFTLIGLIRGFIYEILSITVWIITFYITSYYYNKFSIYFIFIDKQIIRNVISVTILSLSTFIVSSIINNFINFLVSYAGLSIFNKILGGIIGMIKGIFMIVLIIFMMNNFTKINKYPIWKQSFLISQFSDLGRIIYNNIKDIIL